MNRTFVVNLLMAAFAIVVAVLSGAGIGYFVSWAYGQFVPGSTITSEVLFARGFAGAMWLLVLFEALGLFVAWRRGLLFAKISM